MKARDFFARFREPSTYAGLATLAGIFGVPATSGLVQTILQIGTAVAAVGAVAISEKGGQDGQQIR